MKACILSQNGLGDGFISLVLANNLKRLGWDVTTLHGSLGLLARWFPGLSIKQYPEVDAVHRYLELFDRIYVFYTEDYEFIRQIIHLGKLRYPDKMVVIYPQPFVDPRYCPYYRDFPMFKGLSFVENIRRNMSGIKDNGLRNPGQLELRREKTRVLLHVRSSKKQKDWPIGKFMQLARRLQDAGYKPSFIVGENKYRRSYQCVERAFSMPEFQNLDELACYVFESGFLIGVDSGLGHMASSMGVPTITLARRESTINFWRPDWAHNRIITPPKWVPNLKGMRLRDQFWKRLITVTDVFEKFLIDVGQITT